MAAAPASTMWPMGAEIVGQHVRGPDDATTGVVHRKDLHGRVVVRGAASNSGVGQAQELRVDRDDVLGRRHPVRERDVAHEAVSACAL